MLDDVARHDELAHVGFRAREAEVELVELGVIEAGAYADMLIIDGNPIEDIEVMLDYENNFKLIMKDGVAYKNTL